MKMSLARLAGTVVLCCCAALGWGAPETIVIQGQLSAGDGSALAGSRAYRVRFFDAETSGTQAGSDITGSVTVSATGRFSIEIAPPAGAVAAPALYYELAIDSLSTPDGAINAEDVFPDRVKVNSVLFAQDADNLDGVDSSGFATADHTHTLQSLSGAVTDSQVPDNITVDHAATADSLTGALGNPGDQIDIGGGVLLQVAEDGAIEFSVNGERMRLTRLRWRHPASINDGISPGDDPVSTVDACMNAQGDAIVVWRANDGTYNRIYMSECFDGQWRHPGSMDESINLITTINANGPQVVMNDNGNAYIVWKQYDFSPGGAYQLYMSERKNGQWTHPAAANDYISAGVGSVEEFSIAFDNDDNGLIAWRQMDSGGVLRIFLSYTEYDAVEGYVWNHPDSADDYINPSGGGDAGELDTAAANGHAIVAFSQHNGAEQQIFLSAGEFASQAWTWDHPDSLTDKISPDGSDCTGAQTAVSDSGDAIVIWQQQDNHPTTPSLQLFLSERRNGSWQHPAGRSDNISPDEYDADWARVAMRGGDALIVWHQDVAGGLQQAFRSHLRNGNWMHPTDIDDNFVQGLDDETNFYPAVAMNDAGDAIICWTRYPGGLRNLYMTEFRDGAWTAPERFSYADLSAIGPTPSLGADEAIIGWNYTPGKTSISERRWGY
ncbi:hypothetical protein JXA32_13095 [Candidatus Sumerlaeota bacterium]|nr:hypothetical protein [Candidatus Sumerlaeota bacterium]